MRKYRLEFEDQECGLSIPVIIHTSGKDFFDAIDNVRDEIILADRVKEEGLSIIKGGCDD